MCEQDVCSKRRRVVSIRRKSLIYQRYWERVLENLLSFTLLVAYSIRVLQYEKRFHPAKGTAKSLTIATANILLYRCTCIYFSRFSPPPIVHFSPELSPFCALLYSWYNWRSDLVCIAKVAEIRRYSMSQIMILCRQCPLYRSLGLKPGYTFSLVNFPKMSN